MLKVEYPLQNSCINTYRGGRGKGDYEHPGIIFRHSVVRLNENLLCIIGNYFLVSTQSSKFISAHMYEHLSKRDGEDILGEASY